MTTKPEDTRRMGPGSRQRRRYGTCLALLLLVLAAGLLTWHCLPSDKPLTEHARRLRSLSGQENDLCWMTPDRLLLLTTEQIKEPPGGKQLWKGTASLVSLSTGSLTPLTGLTAALNREGGIPWALAPSPDGKRLLWCRRMTMDAWPFPAACTLDGSECRTWACERKLDPHWVDSIHCIEVAHAANVPSTVWIHDVRPSGQDHACASVSQEGRTLLMKRWRQQPHSVEADFSHYGAAGLPVNKVRLNVFSTEEVDTKWEPRSLLSTTVTLPQDEDVVETVLTPRNDVILYRAHQVWQSPLEAWVHRVCPSYRPLPRERETLWISDANGRGLRLLGYQAVEKGRHLDDVQFAPDGRTISFTYGKGLYTLPID